MSEVIPGEESSVGYSTTVRPCPVCEGQVYLDVNDQHIDKKCPCCGGCGTVDIEKFCVCGRPIVYTYKGYIICTSKACHELVDKTVEKNQQAAQITAKAKAKTLPVQLDDDDADYGSWWERLGLFA